MITSKVIFFFAGSASVGALCKMAIVFVALGVGAVSEKIDGIAAIVNDDVILLSEVQSRYDDFVARARQANVTDIPTREVILSQIMERLVLESIQLQEAQLRGVEIEDEELTDAVSTFASQNGMEIEAFLAALEEQGIPYRQFREDVRREMILNRVQRGVVNRRIYISDRDIRDLRTSPFFNDMVSDEFRVGHILLAVEDSNSRSAMGAAEERAREIIQELKAGADFAKLAIENSAAGTALEGGDLGWRKAVALPSLFADVVLTLEPGETADVIANSLGLHIIQLLEKRGASTTTETQTLVRHILIQPSTIRTDEEALLLINDIRGQIIEDQTQFDELAEKYSDDAGTALAGGSLGWTNGADLVDIFRETMTNTSVSEVSAPFRSEFGWHILEVEDRREQNRSEEALDDMALRILHNRRFDEKLQEWLKEIRDEAYVQIRSEDALDKEEI